MIRNQIRLVVTHFQVHKQASNQVNEEISNRGCLNDMKSNLPLLLQ